MGVPFGTPIVYLGLKRRKQAVPREEQLDKKEKRKTHMSITIEQAEELIEKLTETLGKPGKKWDFVSYQPDEEVDSINVYPFRSPTKSELQQFGKKMEKTKVVSKQEELTYEFIKILLILPSNEAEVAEEKIKQFQLDCEACLGLASETVETIVNTTKAGLNSLKKK